MRRMLLSLSAVVGLIAGTMSLAFAQQVSPASGPVVVAQAGASQGGGGQGSGSQGVAGPGTVDPNAGNQGSNPQGSGGANQAGSQLSGQSGGGGPSGTGPATGDVPSTNTRQAGPNPQDFALALIPLLLLAVVLGFLLTRRRRTADRRASGLETADTRHRP